MTQEPPSLLLDLSHSSHTRARTGVQRVARSLLRELGARAAPVCFDPYEDLWRPLEDWECENLGAEDPSGGRGAHWPLPARIRGSLRRAVGRQFRELVPAAAGAAVLVPEIFSPAVADALPALFAATRGPRVAVFHDAIALQLPQHAPPGTAARFPLYLRQLLAFDGVAAVSEDSRAALLDYWRWLGVARTPQVAAIPLGVDPSPRAAHAPEGPGGPVVLSVGTLEGRKNHLALLEACEALWQKGRRFQLLLVGAVNRETGQKALALTEALRARGRPLSHAGPLPEAKLEEAYGACAFTVYPSLAEGFGLPVAESLCRGRACLCRFSGALGETARGGGCLDIGGATAAEIGAGLERMLGEPALVQELESQALGRRMRSWSDYAGALADWIGGLPRGA